MEFGASWVILKTLQSVQVVHFLLNRVLPLGVASFAVQTHTIFISIWDWNTKFLPCFLLVNLLVPGYGWFVFVRTVQMCSANASCCGRHMASVQGLTNVDQSSSNRIVLSDSLLGPVVEWSFAAAGFHNLFLDVFSDIDRFILFQTRERGIANGHSLD